nr:hypothetical protein [Kibdelosporangium sp. MJ126-NF4]
MMNRRPRNGAQMTKPDDVALRAASAVSFVIDRVVLSA